MANSTSILAKKLIDLIDRKIILKSELSRKSGISRTNLDHYLKQTSIPRLDAIDKIADAINVQPHELVKDDNNSLVIPHTLEDCLEAVSKAATGRILLLKDAEVSTDIIPSEILEKLSAIPKDKRMGLYKQWSRSLDAVLGSSQSQTKKDTDTG